MDMNAFLEQVVDKPSVFFVPSEDVAQQVRAVVKTTFDASTCGDVWRRARLAAVLTRASLQPSQAT